MPGTGEIESVASGYDCPMGSFPGQQITHLLASGDVVQHQQHPLTPLGELIKGLVVDSRLFTYLNGDLVAGKAKLAQQRRKHRCGHYMPVTAVTMQVHPEHPTWKPTTTRHLSCDM